MESILDGTLTEAADAIRRRDISALELVTGVLERIERLQPRLNCFIRVEAGAALAAARAADDAIARKDEVGPLHGVPLAHKDMFYRAGKPATCGAEIRRDHVAETDSTALRRLDKAGAIYVGGLNMSEFASNPTGHNDHFGHARNPWNPDHITGGSSSGSGAATAARLAFGALGSDTGGSVRLPATMCGVTGLKPTYGRVSRFGAMPLSWSMDHVGPLARTAEDCALMMSIIAGEDPLDPTASRRPVPDYRAALKTGMAGVRIGVPTSWFGDGVVPEVAAATDTALGILKYLGAEVVDVDLPDMAICTAVGNVLTRVEAATIHRRWLKSRPQDYGSIIRYRLEIGLTMPGTRYVEALNMRGPTLREFAATVFSKVDLLYTPTMPIRVPTLADTEPTPQNLAYIANALTRCTRPINYLGLPAISAPCGFDAGGLPIGFQLVGKPFGEARLLAAVHAYQQATDWHRYKPAMV